MDNRRAVAANKRNLERNQAFHIRRVRKLRCQAALSAAAFVLILIFGFFHNPAEANADQSTPVYKYYTSIEVQYGETLWSIAKNYCTEEYHSLDEYMKEVRAINHMQDSALSAGQYLIVPYYSNEIK